MPIIRTYACPSCNHYLSVTLSSDEWDSPPPECPVCAKDEMQQDFKPVAIGGSNVGKAAALAEEIMRDDYGVANYKSDGRAGGRGKISYKDQTPAQKAQAWGAAQGVLNTAIALGRETRLKHGGDGLDMLQRALKSGDQPDLIEASKRRSMRAT